MLLRDPNSDLAFTPVRRNDRVKWLATSAVLILLLVAALSAVHARQTPRELVQKGDSLWKEKSLELAAEAYRSALKSDPKLPERAELELRILQADIKAKHWDLAIEESDAYQRRNAGTPYEGLGLLWRGRLYVVVDHNGFHVGKKSFRGTDVPKSEGSDAAEPFDAQGADGTITEQSLRQCRLLLRNHINSMTNGSSELKTRLQAALAECDLDIATRTRQYNSYNDQNFRPDQVDWKIDLHEQIDWRWPRSKQLMYLYEEICETDALTSGSNHHSTVMARLSEAVLIVKLRQQVTYDQADDGQNYPSKYVPYATKDPIALLEDTVHLYPADPEAGQLLYMAAVWMAEKGDTGNADLNFHALIAAYPHDTWTHPSQIQLQVLETPALDISVPHTAQPGQALKIQLTSRNVSTVHFTAYRVHPELYYGKVSYFDQFKKYPAFNDFIHHFQSDACKAAYHKEKVAEWTATTSTDGRHKLCTDSINTPLDRIGAYVVEAKAGDRGELTVATIAFVTDITVTQKLDHDSVLVYVAESVTGKPVPGAKLTLWEPTRATDNIERDAIYVDAVTDSTGISRSALPTPTDITSDSVRLTRNAEVFVDAGNGRYAVTAPTSFADGTPLDEKQIRQAYVITDRPLYRPGQVVNYRVVLVQGRPARYQLAANQPVILHVKDTDGDIQTIAATTGPTGAINNHFELPAGVRPGDYRITVESVPAKADDDNGSRKQSTVLYGFGMFRIEEYKKPEFTVTVAPAKSEVRVGEKMDVTISAGYFFGSPVAKAHVHYKVFRAPFVHPDPFGPRIAWFKDEQDAKRERQFPGRGGAGEQLDTTFWGAPDSVYREGDLVTDAKGEAKLSFATNVPKTPRGYRFNPGLTTDQSYRVEAQVVDDSRRQVTGSGTAIAGAQRFHASIRFDRSIVLTGDALHIDVNTRDANDKPIAVDGNITIWKQIPAIDERKELDTDTGKMKVVQPYVPAREEKEGLLPIRTEVESGGTGSALWHPSNASDYNLRFEAADGWAHTVTAEMPILAYNDHYSDLLKPNDGRFGLILEKELYTPGDLARMVVVAQKPDSYALFTEESNGKILNAHPVFISGRCTIIEAPITSNDISGVTYTISVFKDGEINRTEMRASVAATNRILTLTATPDKATYLPGEHARIHIHATGADGKPVQGEITVGVVDEALLAMQGELIADIRSALYGPRGEGGVVTSASTDFDPGIFMDKPAGPSDTVPTLRLPADVSWFTQENNNYYEDIPSYVEFAVPTVVPGHHRYRYKSDGTIAVDAFYSEQSGEIEGVRFRRVSQRLYAVAKAVPTTAASPQELFSPVGMVADGVSSYRFGVSGASSGAARAGGFGGMGSNRGGMAGAPGQGGAGLGGESRLVAATVRSNFADTAYWMPALETDANGDAVAEFSFPDNITKWHIAARGITRNVSVGVADAQAVTRKNILVRLQAPRFFVERDQVTISANVHNYLDSAKDARVGIAVDPTLFAAADFAGGGTNALVRTIKVDHDGEVRVDWNFKVLKPGTALIKVTAQTDQESDAQQMSFPIRVHGIEKLNSASGTLRDGGSAEVTLDLPEYRNKGASLLDVQLSPSLAAVVVDALPYLEDYPYGCVEQTLSRFLPTVTTAKALRDSGLNLEDLAKRAQALEQQRAAIPLEQQIVNSGYTFPSGKPGVLDAGVMASRMFLYGRSHAPVFDSAQLHKMTDAGLAALYDQQRQDGSWGWWKGSTTADNFLTAHALEGLVEAKRAGVEVRPDVISKACAYLYQQLDDKRDLNLSAFLGYVLTLAGVPDTISSLQKLTEDTLFAGREHLSPYGQALLALTLQLRGDKDKAGILLRNLVTSAKIDQQSGTVHWESEDRETWRWYNDKPETTAIVLRALVAAGPAPGGPATSDLAPMAVRWLVANRTGGHWSSTRETANVVAALMQYAVARGELNPNFTAVIDLDGKVKKTVKIDSTNALLFDTRFLVGDELLASGGQKLHITMQGSGTLYWNSYLTYFDQSEPIKASSNSISVERKYFRIPASGSVGKGGKKGRVVVSTTDDDDSEVAGTTNVPTANRIPLADGATLTSGDIIEVELYLKSDNDYQYVLLEDMKPAGCEAVATKSGIAYGDGLCSDMELRDDRVAFFMDTLPQGTRRITYRLRAEIPGRFHVLPANSYAMYAPAIRATSDEAHLQITDVPVMVHRTHSKKP